MPFPLVPPACEEDDRCPHFACPFPPKRGVNSSVLSIPKPIPKNPKGGAAKIRSLAPKPNQTAQDVLRFRPVHDANATPTPETPIDLDGVKRRQHNKTRARHFKLVIILVPRSAQDRDFVDLVGHQLQHPAPRSAYSSREGEREGREGTASASREGEHEDLTVWRATPR